jgi:predicted ATPase
MGLHTGAPQVRDGEYWGVDVHYAARLAAAAHGGQVLLSASTRALVPDCPVADLGEHGLKDFPVRRRLFQLLAAGRGAADFPPPRTLETVQTNLPSAIGALVGRERELADVCAHLTGDARLVTVTGVGGSGKTRLALACASEMLGDFADGVFLVSLSSIASAVEVPAAVATVIGVASSEDRGPDVAVAEHLQDRELLLVADNMEHVLDAATFLAGVLESAPGVRILATSQAPLRLRGETVIPLASLAVPDANAADTEAVASAPAVALFAERASAADPAFVLDDTTAPIVAELCRRLDGLPLAIELAAARVRIGGPERLLAAVARGLDSLGTGARDLPDRQRGLRAALDWTVSLLESDERTLFAALGAFAEAWTVEQSEALLADEIDVWEATATLLDFSLIRTRGDGRFTMGETVRTYARELLGASGREHELRRRHAVVLADEMEPIADELVLDFDVLTARTKDRRAELTAALAWAAANDADVHRRLVAAVAGPFYFTGRFAEIAADLARYAEDAAPAGDVAARLLQGHAYGLGARGRLVEGAAAALGSAERWNALGNEAAEVLSRFQATHLLATEGALDEARAHVAAARALPSVATDTRLRDILLCEQGVVHLYAGELDDAEAAFATILSRPSQGDFAFVVALTSAGDVAVARGNYEVALERFVVSLERMSRSGQLHNMLLQCLCIACSLAGLGRDAEAIEVMAAVDAAAARDGAMVIAEDAFPQGRGLLPAARARLGDEAVAAACERGARRDLDDLLEWALSMAPQPVAAP